MKTREEVLEILRYLNKIEKIRQVDIGEVLGLSRQTIVDWMRGKNLIPNKNITFIYNMLISNFEDELEVYFKVKEALKGKILLEDELFYILKKESKLKETENNKEGILEEVFEDRERFNTRCNEIVEMFIFGSGNEKVNVGINDELMKITFIKKGGRK